MAFQRKTVVETQAWRSAVSQRGEWGSGLGWRLGEGILSEQEQGQRPCGRSVPAAVTPLGWREWKGDGKRWGQKVMRVRTTEGLWSLRLCSEGGGSPGAFQAGGRELT